MVYNPTPAPTVVQDDTVVYSAAAPVAWTDLDLSAAIGARACMVILQIRNLEAAVTCAYRFRQNGDIGVYTNLSGISNLDTINQGTMGDVLVRTDAAGIVEWIANADRNTAVCVKAYWHAPG